MTQAVATSPVAVAEEHLNALLESQRTRFIKDMEYDHTIVAQTDDGPVAKLGDEELPLLDMAFDLQIVQPGHVSWNKNLANFVGKILVVYDSNDPTAESASTLNLMPITIVRHGFKNFDQYNDKDGDDANRLLCYSNDGVRPSTRVAMPMHSVCSELVLRNGKYVRNTVCPRAMWEGDNKPECREEIVLGLFDIERKVPVRLQLHGKALTAYNALQWAYRQARNVARLKKKSINDYIIRMTVENHGTYVKPVFKLMEPEDTLPKPATFLPVCKYYLTTLFARQTAAEEQPVSTVQEVVNAVATEADTKAVEDGQNFTL